MNGGTTIIGGEANDDASEALAQAAAALAPDLSTRSGRTAGVHTQYRTNKGWDVSPLRFETTDSANLTWAVIVGEDNIVEKRIADVGEAVMASSVDGVALGSDRIVGGVADGARFTATWKGIPGTAFCDGGDCEVQAVAGESGLRRMVGSFYFTPSMPDETYVANADGTAYEPETLFATWGYWLREREGSWMIHTFARNGAGTDGTANMQLRRRNFTLAPGTRTNRLPTQATYTGRAVGVSIRRSDGAMDVGHFTADVDLTARFGTGTSRDRRPSGMVGGSISNFRGEAINRDWSVTLEEAPIHTGVRTLNAPATTGTGDRGSSWSINGYGTDDTARPAGIFGGFSLFFRDGAAASAYATRKRE